MRHNHQVLRICPLQELKKWKPACPPNKLNLIFPNRFGEPMTGTCMVKRFFKPPNKKGLQARWLTNPLF